MITLGRVIGQPAIAQAICLEAQKNLTSKRMRRLLWLLENIGWDAGRRSYIVRLKGVVHTVNKKQIDRLISKA